MGPARRGDRALAARLPSRVGHRPRRARRPRRRVHPGQPGPRAGGDLLRERRARLRGRPDELRPDPQQGAEVHRLPHPAGAPPGPRTGTAPAPPRRVRGRARARTERRLPHGPRRDRRGGGGRPPARGGGGRGTHGRTPRPVPRRPEHPHGRGGGGPAPAHAARCGPGRSHLRPLQAPPHRAGPLLPGARRRRHRARGAADHAGQPAARRDPLRAVRPHARRRLLLDRDVHRRRVLRHPRRAGRHPARPGPHHPVREQQPHPAHDRRPPRARPGRAGRRTGARTAVHRSGHPRAPGPDGRLLHAVRAPPHAARRGRVLAAGPPRQHHAALLQAPPSAETHPARRRPRGAAIRLRRTVRRTRSSLGL